MTKHDISELEVLSSRKRKLPSKFSDSVITKTTLCDLFLLKVLFGF